MKVHIGYGRKYDSLVSLFFIIYTPWPLKHHPVARILNTESCFMLTICIKAWLANWNDGPSKKSLSLPVNIKGWQLFPCLAQTFIKHFSCGRSNEILSLDSPLILNPYVFFSYFFFTRCKWFFTCDKFAFSVFAKFLNYFVCVFLSGII